MWTATHSGFVPESVRQATNSPTVWAQVPNAETLYKSKNHGQTGNAKAYTKRLLGTACNISTTLYSKRKLTLLFHLKVIAFVLLQSYRCISSYAVLCG